MINITVQQAITAALQAQKIVASQSSESQSQSSSVKNNDHIIVLVWKIEDLDYFQLNLADKNDAHTIMIESQTHYQDVYIFTDCAWDVVANKDETMIKNNLHACLHRTTLSWHTIELSNIKKKIMWALFLEKEWISALVKQFKSRISEAVDKLQHLSFSMKNVKAGMSITEFTQTVFRYAKAAQIDSIFQQLVQVWMKLNSELHQDISESADKIIISEFLQLLQMKEDVWKDIILQIKKVNCQQYQN